MSGLRRGLCILLWTCSDVIDGWGDHLYSRGLARENAPATQFDLLDERQPAAAGLRLVQDDRQVDP